MLRTLFQQLLGMLNTKNFLNFEIKIFIFIENKRISYKHLNFNYFENLIWKRFIIFKVHRSNTTYIKNIDKSPNVNIVL